MDTEKYMLPCMNKSIFGIDCLGCGTQRALVLLYNGEFSKAFHMFPPIYTTLLFFAVVLLHFADRSRNYSKLLIALAVINVAGMIISYIYKLSNIF